MASRKKVIVATSGGVDSSVAAAIVSREHDAVALHVTKHDLPGLANDIRERDEESARSAASVAAALGIPIRFVEAGRHFDRLVDFFCGEYNAGRTPNPCVVCNLVIKWRILLETAQSESADFVATGHYARVETRGDGAHLLRSKGGPKDQTYFLHRLTQNELARTIFPLAQMTKDETRALAAELGLRAAERAESQEICFVGGGGYGEILRSRTPGAVRAGEVIDGAGKVLGTHEGYQFYTIGQRKGLKIALGRPAYVTGIDAEAARVTLGGAGELLSSRLTVADVNWIVAPWPDKPFDAIVRIRYSHAGTAALVTPAGRSAVVEFHSPVKAATPGQAAVFYAGDEVVGGGWIAGRQGEFA